jgi:hypothetical protein
MEGRIKLGQHSPPSASTLSIAQHGFLGLSGQNSTCFLPCSEEFFGFFLSSGKNMGFDSFNQSFKTFLLGQSLQTEISGNEKGITSKTFYNLVD